VSSSQGTPRPIAPLAWRGWVVLGALFCLAGQAARLGHLVLVRHASCAEHDALVHAPPAADAPLAPDHRQALVGALPAERPHEDDHCWAVGLGRKDVLLTAVDPGHDPTPAGPPAALQRPAAPPPASLPLLLLAPKSSPPAPPSSFAV
jgi:hypothetical protein